jgi:hypothetical protein
MNERIRELAKQAGHRYCPSSNSGPLRVEYLTPELEKFAELIVRECMTIGFNTVYKVDDDSAAVTVYQNIKEHFGVEE